MEYNTPKENVRRKAMKEYDAYVGNSKYITDNQVYSMSVMASVGYFLKAHSRDPMLAVSRYLTKNNISYKKANEIRMLLSVLK